MSVFEDAVNLYRRNRTENVEGIRGEIGLLNTDGVTYTVRVAGEANKVYVRLHGDPAQTIEAYNVNTAHLARLPVMVAKRSARWEVLGVDPVAITTFAGEAAGTLNLPPMAVAPDVVIPAKQFEPGRARPLHGDDLVVWIEEFVYDGAVLGGAAIDLSGVSITASTKAWVVISINPADNTLTATKGTEVGLAMTLTRADAAAIAVPAGDLPLWAYLLISGDTVLPSDPARAADIRDFFGGSATADGMTSFDVDADSGTAETLSHGDTLVIAGGVGLASTVAATNTVTVDLDIASLTELTSLDEAADMFVVYDDGAGQHKKIKAENLPGGSGVFVPAGTIWQPDAAPASPNANDDEFADESAGVPNGWTEMDFDGTTTVTETAAGLIMTQTTHANDGVVGIYKVLPAGDFTIYTRVSLLTVDTGANQTFRAGITLYEDATSSTADLAIVTWQFNPSNAGPAGGTNLHTAYNAAPSGLGSASGSFSPMKSHNGAYLRLRRNGTNYTFDVSDDGIGWSLGWTSFTLGFTPAHMGLSVNNVNTGETCAARFGFFRYLASDAGALGIMEGRRVEYYV